MLRREQSQGVPMVKHARAAAAQRFSVGEVVPHQ